uniref:Uncharacterized protein n=1 Tax=Caenorhabditis japonica TaxID=281687 RepID=A0A8R1HX96_CAEJA
MGIKGDKKATSDQARLARLTLEGNSGTEEDIQLMIKTIIETTGCTQAQAEIALLDSDNSLYGAINHILESGDNLDTWTEQKGAKKEKKKQEESSFNNRGFVARGRGGGSGFADRGGRGRSNGAPRESRDSRENRENRDTRDRDQGKDFGGAPRSNRGGFERPFVGRGRGGGRGGYSRAVAPSSNIEPDSFNNDLDENRTRVETTVTEVQPPVEESVTATVPTSSAPAPISFAAVAAAAHRKEELRKQQLHNPQPAAPPRRSLSPAPPLVAEPEPVEEEVQPAFSEPESSNQQEKEDSFYPSDSSALAEEQIPNVSTHIDENVQSSPEQTNQAWTTQLKTDLGIGLHEAPGLGLSPIPSNAAPISSVPDQSVKFVANVPTNVHDYSFGFVEAPPSPQIPSAETSAASISNGEYNLKSTSPPLSYGQSNRGLAYVTSTSSYQPDRLASNKSQFNNPGPLPSQQSAQPQAPQPQPQQTSPAQSQPGQYVTSTSSYQPADRLASNKSQFNNPGQLPSQQSVQQQPPQQQQPQPTQQQPTPPPQPQPGHPQHPQHMLFTPQLAPYPYMNSYMNMYNPIPGVRDEQYAALMQYGMGVDLANLSRILPQPTTLAQSPSSQQVSSGQQRDPAHSLMDFQKFNQQNPRDQQPQQQPSNVGPPPGFQSNSYLQQPNLTSLFMQQPYQGPHAFGFMNMMPNVGNNGQGRQMYGQDDDRKGYDKMAPKPATQQSQHSQYQHNGGNIGKYGNMSNKPYNWGN